MGNAHKKSRGEEGRGGERRAIRKNEGKLRTGENRLAIVEGKSRERGISKNVY